MGKRLRKQELLLEIQRERRALDDALAHLAPRQMTRSGVTRGGWSIKDVLAHLVEWQRMNLDWYEAGLRGEKPAMPAPGFTLRELPRLNETIYKKHHRRTLQAVLQDYRSYHERVVALIRALPDADLVTPGRFPWTGPSWTLSDYLRASTASHYLWARTRIRRWARAQVKAHEARRRSTATRSKRPSAAAKPALLAGGNPRIAKADGNAPVRAYIAALPGWKRGVGRRLDALVVRNVPGVRKAVKWNSPFYGIEGQGWFLGLHSFTNYVKVTFFRGTSLRPVPPGGTGKEARWIDVHEHDLDAARMATWIRQAAALPGWGGS